MLQLEGYSGFLTFMRIALVGLGLLVPLAVLGAGQRGADGPSTSVTFRDIAQAAGLVFRHVNGASPAKHFAETMGSGGLFFDFDGDGWIDILDRKSTRLNSSH